MNYKTQTLETYNQNLPLFLKRFKDATNIQQRAEFETFITLLTGKKILDLGCGLGEHSLFFKKQGLDPLCVDLSPKFVEHCRKNGLNAQVMDLEHLDFEDNSFDGIWAVTSLLHVPKKNLPSIIQKVQKILKPGGILYVCMLKGNSEGFVPYKENPQFKRFFASWNYDELLEQFKCFTHLPFDFEQVTVSPGKEYIQFFFKKTIN